MSEFREDLLVTSIDKKRIIKTIIVAIVLISAFAFSLILSSLIFNTLRPYPSDQLAEAEEETGITLTLPPFPYNLSDFQDMNLTQDQLDSLLDALQDMIDGDIDDMDLGNFSEAQAALMTSEIEVFRVFGYSDFNSMSNKLWKYECFDDYVGDGWQSTAASQIYDFYTYGDYGTYHWDKDLLRIKTPLTPSISINSMVIPSLFHTPFIMEGSISDNFGSIDWSNPPVLYKDDFNSSILDIYFNNDVDVNMSYELFGLNLPSNDQINTTAIHASYTPLPIQNKFLQLPPTVQAYLSNNPNVYTHYLALNSTISPNDNAFMVANKIRNYLQFYFSLPANPDNYTSAPAGRDTVDYFCETQEGMWVEFATAFCVFARIFGVSCRFVDGFNSMGIEEIWDNQDFQNTFAVKYKNIYNWAEIFVPTDITGAGDWVQIDVLLDSYGVGGNPWSDPWSSTNYSLIVNSNFTTGYRNQFANITATLTLNSIPVPNSTITFTDHPDYRIPTNVIGQDPTDLNGQASILIPIDDTQTAGFHVISAIYNGLTINSTTYFVYGDVDVDLTNVNPQEVNISISTQTNIQGYVIDPLTNEKVVGAAVEFLLLNKGTNTRASATPFDIPQVETDSNGDFDVILNVDPSVLVGQYDIRVDFNGTFYGGWPIAVGIMNGSSNIMDFNVTKGQIRKLWFLIDGFTSNDALAPIRARYSSITLKAYVLNETNSPLANQNVEFYDYRTSSFITSNTTNVQGYATHNYVVGTQAISGPNLLYAQLGTLYNYSYYVLNDAPTIHIFSGPTPRVINRTGGGATLFNIVGQITDTLDGSKPLSFSTITLRLLRGGSDNSSYLVAYDSYPYQTGSLGMFDLTFGVASNTPTGNYTLRMDFNGAIDLSSYPYPYLFNLPILSNSTTLDYELQVTAPDTLKFDFWIDGFTSYDYNQPSINRNGQMNLSTYLEWGSSPIGDGETIQFYDETQGQTIGLASTTNGRASLIYYTNASTIAGPHLISARWGSNYNYSYFILNDQINVTLISGPTPREIYRSGTIQRTFNLQGTITDGLNGSPIKFPEIQVILLDGTMTDVSYYLSSSIFRLDDTGGFDLTISVSSGTPANNYTVGVGFNGIFIYSFPNNQFNEHDFYLFTPNFTDYESGYYPLKVIDPYNISIWFSIDGNPTRSYYDNSNLPERYSPGDFINFSVYITQSGSPVTSGTVVLRDVYIGSQIGTYDYDLGDNGYCEFNINTTLWHAGLHQIEVQWSTFPTINSTYIIINKTITISAYSSSYHIQRDFDIFSVFGSVQDGTTNLRGLEITILLFDSSHNDVSSLYLNLAGSQTITVYNGIYQFDVNFISLNCPQGDYYLRIDFNGSINEAGISLSNYMINTSSMIIPVNITAGTYIIGNFETSFEEGFYEGDYVDAYGYLYWDNGSLITGTMTITITIEDGLGGIIKTEIGTTDGSGWFNISVYIDSYDWPDQTEVWVSFDPQDYYIEPIKIELYRP